MPVTPTPTPAGPPQRTLPAYPPGAVLTDAQGRRYELIRRVGEGGFGEVYAARRTTSDDFDKPVAVKILHRSAGEEAAGRLRDEARLLSKVAHLHRAILKLEELVELDGKLALVTEFVEGENLSACLRDPQRMPVPALLEVIQEACEALVAVNAVHRDLKPSNIRIERSGGVKLLDFGIAFSVDVAREVETQNMGVIGTPPYIAPERFTSAEFLPASDIFALGCILYEGIAGERFLNLSTALLRGLHLGSHQEWSEFVAQRLAAPVVTAQPVELQHLLRELLRFHPDERPTAADAAQRCEELAHRYPAALRLKAWCRQRRWPDEAHFELPGHPGPQRPRRVPVSTEIRTPRSHSTLAQGHRSSSPATSRRFLYGVLALWTVLLLAVIAVAVQVAQIREEPPAARSTTTAPGLPIISQPTIGEPAVPTTPVEPPPVRPTPENPPKPRVQVAPVPPPPARIVVPAPPPEPKHAQVRWVASLGDQDPSSFNAESRLVFVSETELDRKHVLAPQKTVDIPPGRYKVQLDGGEKFSLTLYSGEHDVVCDRDLGTCKLK